MRPSISTPTRLVALDIDGTLIPPARYGDGAILPSARIRVAVTRLRESGIVVVLASGRMFPGTVKIAEFLGLPGPIICQQGCAVHLLDGTMTHEFPIELSVAIEIVNYARELGHAFEWFNPLRYIASAQTRATIDYGIVSGIEPEYRPDPEHSGVVPTGVGIISTAAEATHIHRELTSRYTDTLHLLDFPDVTVAVAADANKGHSLSLLCQDLGIDRNQVVAIGDSVNDASMLAWAGRGVAMAHSDAYAMDAAHEVLTHDGDDPLAQFLESLL